MRKLTIASLTVVGIAALAVPAAAQVVYETVPDTAVVTAPAPAVVVPSGAQAYAYVAPAAPPTNVYSYANGNYSYSKYRDASGCTVEMIRDYGSATTHRNCY
jgi:hypothetical protein